MPDPISSTLQSDKPIASPSKEGRGNLYTQRRLLCVIASGMYHNFAMYGLFLTLLPFSSIILQRRIRSEDEYFEYYRYCN